MHAGNGEKQPRVVAHESRRGRTERVDDPAGHPRVEPGRYEYLHQFVDRGGREERRQQPARTIWPIFGSIARPLCRHVGRPVNARVGECRGEVLAEPRPQPGAAERDETGSLGVLS